MDNIKEYTIIFLISGIVQLLMQKYISNIGYKFNQVLKIIFAIIVGLINCYLFYKYSFGYNFLLYSLLIEVLIVITLLDFQYEIILNRLNISVAIIGLFNIIITKDFYNGILAFFTAGGLFFILAIISNGGIGGGDIKLIAPLGLIFGIYPILYIIMLSFIFASVIGIVLIILRIKGLKSSIALAPYISLATISLIIYYM
ncbi:prepilin peptidase [Senegalia massiliensis]|uniref:Prepilin type IV endopeptidase peptidase domain-containing protein n=1 Tax=Senegalia massiliensis TaxID=1720316 RepID=A0A845R207_9CLOT|nr:prepilin peptidase [Senegalia massiliensis]NBI07578.1 hypothetical protein [Senegalia massiliensis]